MMGLKRRPWIYISTKHVHSLKSHYVYLFVCLFIARMEIRGQLARIDCFLPTCGFWGLNSGHQPWHQAPLPTEPSHQSHKLHSFTEASASWLEGAYGTQYPKFLTLTTFVGKDGAGTLLNRTQHRNQISAGGAPNTQASLLPLTMQC